MARPGPDPGDPYLDADADALRRHPGAKWAGVGADVIPAAVADGDAVAIEPVAAAIGELLERGDVGYAAPALDDEVVEAWADWTERHHGHRPDVASTVVMVDVIQAVSIFLDRICGPGDGVIIQTPALPGLLEEIADIGREVVANPLVADDERGWVIDLDHLEHLAAAPSVTALVLVTPHNPTGRSFTAEELAAVADIADRFGLAVVSDEIFADLVLDGRRHVPYASVLAARGGSAAPTMTATSAVKTFDLGGLPCAVASCGTPEVAAVIRARSGQRGYVSTPAAAAAVAAWTHGDPYLAPRVAALEDRRDRFAATLALHLPEIGYRPGEATPLAWLDCGPLDLAGPPAAFFEERARVRLAAGGAFGDGYGDHARVCLATSAALIDEIAERLVTAVDLWRAGGGA